MTVAINIWKEFFYLREPICAQLLDVIKLQLLPVTFGDLNELIAVIVRQGIVVQKMNSY